MARPIRVLFRSGNFNGRWECDVPCEYTTNDDDSAEVDVSVGEAGPPAITPSVRRANPSLRTAARSMESTVNYPALKQLPEQVDCAMTTNLRTACVPVVYLTRSSIRKWGEAPVVWNASMLRAHYPALGTGTSGGGMVAAGQVEEELEEAATPAADELGGSAVRKPRDRSAAVFVARNCHSKNGREKLIKRLDTLLRGGVDRPGACLNSMAWPKCPPSNGKKCGKHELLRRYPFYLALENSDEEDYVSEKVFHALESGVLPIYAGAPNIADFVPAHSVVDLHDKAFGGSVEKLVAHLHSLLEDPERYASYFEWKHRPLPAAFQRRFGFVSTHAKCRLCRWAYAKKYNLPWSQREQRPMPTSGGVSL
jgi:hypothetical protein